MMKVGVTGGIGSGKSTVCRLFAAPRFFRFMRLASFFCSF